MAYSQIAPILTAEKATLTFSAEKNGKVRVTYQGWTDQQVVPFGSQLIVTWGMQGVEVRIVEGGSS